jgi:hypothetical protein
MLLINKGEMIMAIVYVTGLEIYNAAVQGTKCGYNRTASDVRNYERVLQKCYDWHMGCVKSKREAKRICTRTKNSWRNAKLPVEFMVEHKHKGGEIGEPHARICVIGEGRTYIDVPMDSWNALKKYVV